MPKFLKKPIVVRATQWWYDLPVEGVKSRKSTAVTPEQQGTMDTLEGFVTVLPGDWIITGTTGERYPCKPHIFESLYDPLPNQPDDSPNRQFVRKSVIVEAEQWWPGIPMEGVRTTAPERGKTEVRGLINTPSGTVFVTPGDWIITGTIGERYPCKPHIFEATYERIEDTPPTPEAQPNSGQA